MTTRPTAQQWEQAWLPLWPLASDDLLEGIYRQSRPEALQRRYVEANPQALSNLLVVDIDHGDAALRALGTRPLPHVIVENPRNGHAHAVWGLREPVTRTEYAHRKPLAFAASVTEGLRRAVDGDRSHRHAGRHHHCGAQRVEASQRPRCDRHSDHRQNGVCRHHAC